MSINIYEVVLKYQMVSFLPYSPSFFSFHLSNCFCQKKRQNAPKENKYIPKSDFDNLNKTVFQL